MYISTSPPGHVSIHQPHTDQKARSQLVVISLLGRFTANDLTSGLSDVSVVFCNTKNVRARNKTHTLKPTIMKGSTHQGQHGRNRCGFSTLTLGYGHISRPTKQDLHAQINNSMGSTHEDGACRSTTASPTTLSLLRPPQFSIAPSMCVHKLEASFHTRQVCTIYVHKLEASFHTRHVCTARHNRNYKS